MVLVFNGPNHSGTRAKNLDVRSWNRSLKFEFRLPALAESTNAMQVKIITSASTFSIACGESCLVDNTAQVVLVGCYMSCEELNVS